MLKTIESSVVSAFRVDDDEVVGGVGDAGAGGSIVERKVGSITWLSDSSSTLGSMIVLSSWSIPASS